MVGIVWHPSYGELAAQQLDEWRADAACQRSATTNGVATRQRQGGLGVLLGRALVRLGERLGGSAARPAMR